MSYAVGHNDAGYLPESDISLVETFEEAKSHLINDLKFLEDYAESESVAEALCAAAEDVNLWNGPDCIYVELIESEHCIPSAFWIQESDEEVDDDLTD